MHLYLSQDTLQSLLLKVGALCLLAACFTGCSGAKFYEQEHLVKPVMIFESDPTEISFQQKVLYSREGSVGGIGSGAGGGCGCY